MSLRKLVVGSWMTSIPRWQFQALALIAQALFVLYFTDLNVDDLTQFEMAHQWLEGKGISLERLSRNDLSAVILEKEILWPPPYIMFLGGLIYVFQDYFIALYALHILGISLILVLLRPLSQELGISIRGQKYLYLFFTLSFSPFAFVQPTDLWAGAMIFVGAYFGGRLFSSQKISLSSALLLGILAFSPLAFKYVYYALFIIPGAYILAYLSRWRRAYLASAALILLLLGLFTGAYLWSLWQYAGEISYTERASTADFHWEFLAIDPFIFKTFFYTEILENYLIIRGEHTSRLALIFKGMAQVFTGLGLGVILYQVWNHMKRNREAALDSSQFLALIGVSTLLLNILYLMTLSYVLPTQVDGEYVWTYVKETRYYLPAMLWSLLFILKLSENQAKTFVWAPLSAYLMVLSLGLAFSYLAFRTYNLNFRARPNLNVEHYKSLYVDLKQHLEASQVESPRVFTSSNIRYNSFARLANWTSVSCPSNLDQLKSTQEIQVLMHCFPSDLKHYQAQLDLRKAKIVGRLANGDLLYSFTLSPEE